MSLVTGIVTVLACLSAVSAQSPVYGQCGGIGWTGATTCAAGSTCVKSNDYYSQCIPGAATSTASTTTPSTTTSTGTTSTAKPTVYLAGDSTMTAAGNNDGTAGWGVYLSDYINLPVVNDAIAGRSARSFTREGRFTAMATNVKAGDYVIIEFGHNDGGSLTPTDNGRTDCNPVNNNYATTCQTTYNGVKETVLTFEAYLVNAAKLFQSKGANVIISGATPNNVCEGGSYVYSSSRFVAFTSDAAKATNSIFVDHGQTTANAYKAVGCTTVNSYYPHDHTHTSPAGANTVAKAFVQGLETTSSTLNQYVKAKV